MMNKLHDSSAKRIFLISAGLLLCPGGTANAEVDFNRDIRPILSDTCFKCHGPDEGPRQAELRLDTENGLLGERDGERIIIAGKAEQSELFRRISSGDPDERMPPVDSKLSLTQQQIGLIRQWIAEGAKWKQHWSFVALERPALPPVNEGVRIHNAIDYFVAARLAHEHLRQSPEADKTTLIRRVTLDLTGLPPTLAEVEDFLGDDSANAYEKLVDRLLESPAYGERMATVWLDAARYADTSGYQNDGPRDMWRWRDWVIDAYNAGMPFDRFTTEQLAGDLLLQPTLEQRIATGFNRNHRGNAEGGVIPEEFQVEYVVDRVETTGTVWLGLTIGCARCHEHKYDPILQKEFYQVFSFFNNVPENGRAIKEGNSPPYLKAPTANQQRKLQLIDAEIANLQPHVTEEKLAAEQLVWEQQEQLKEKVDWTVKRGQILRYDFDVASSDGEWPVKYREGEPSYELGIQGNAAQFDGQRFVDAGEVANFGYFDKFSLAAWVRADQADSGTIVSRMTDAEESDGYYVQIIDGHVHVNLVKRWLDDCIRTETEEQITPGEWTHVLVTYDGSRVANGITVYLNGKAATLKANYDFINQTFAAEAPLRIGAGGGPKGRFRGLIDDVRVYDRCLKPGEAAIVAEPQSIDLILAIEPAKRTPAQQKKVRAFFLARRATKQTRHFFDALGAREEERQRLVESFPTVMVMQEMAQPRKTHVLIRGEYDKPGEPVVPGVPAVFPKMPEGAASNRLGLAKWLTDSSHPLTARVAVNRYWQMYFGTGLVKSAEDFGTQGERPSHPELLDWLASEFIRTGWDVKAMQRLIVTSAAYRQSSQVTAPLFTKDPENRLLARGPRYRLPAETVRDQALAAAGLLAEHLGGPSVKPYQPGDLWKDIATDSDYVQDHGANLYRRSMYTYWKRTVVPPAMSAFDGAAREMCSVRPRRTNTPLQALTLMNDVTFVEAARVLAQRVMQESDSAADRLSRIFQRVLSRQPNDRELAILVEGLAEHVAQFQADSASSEKLIAAGEYPLPDSLDKAELAAYTTIASLVLNLDETVTKQ
jgi:hypothetical protein